MTRPLVQIPVDPEDGPRDDPEAAEITRLRHQLGQALRVNQLLQDALSRLEAENLTLRQQWGPVDSMRRRGGRLWWVIPGGRRW